MVLAVHWCQGLKCNKRVSTDPLHSAQGASSFRMDQ